LLQCCWGDLVEPGAGLEEVDETQKVIIAAQACVLLLHRPLADLPKLRTAIVYPGVYRARELRHTDEGVEVEENEARHGEAWSYGVLLLSWEDVAYDSAHIDDGQNVVFHEVAHALDDQTGEADGVPLLADQETVAAWTRAFERAFTELIADVGRRRRTVLDPYAAEDPAEFFAVATETFLEEPVAFQAAYPEMYRLLGNFYGLDPASWADRLGANSQPAR
jgi:Mlc titration factor MtfA (ptsG expression regulator)